MIFPRVRVRIMRGMDFSGHRIDGAKAQICIYNQELTIWPPQGTTA